MGKCILYLENYQFNTCHKYVSNATKEKKTHYLYRLYEKGYQSFNFDFQFFRLLSRRTGFKVLQVNKSCTICIKFRYFEKAAKIFKISIFYLTFLRKFKTNWDISSSFWPSQNIRTFSKKRVEKYLTLRNRNQTKTHKSYFYALF